MFTYIWRITTNSFTQIQELHNFTYHTKVNLLNETLLSLLKAYVMDAVGDGHHTMRGHEGCLHSASRPLYSLHIYIALMYLYFELSSTFSLFS
jgi:hypothetical protein